MHNWDDLQCLMDLEDIFNDETLILEQFTGLHDKHGKEIFEGDIVRAIPERNSCGVVAAVNGVDTLTRIVIWLEEEAAFGWKLLDGSVCQSGYSMCRQNEPIFEIIGNIHENPELLNP